MLQILIFSSFQTYQFKSWLAKPTEKVLIETKVKITQIELVRRKSIKLLWIELHTIPSPYYHITYLYISIPWGWKVIKDSLLKRWSYIPPNSSPNDFSPHNLCYKYLSSYKPLSCQQLLFRLQSYRCWIPSELDHNWPDMTMIIWYHCDWTIYVIWSASERVFFKKSINNLIWIIFGKLFVIDRGWLLAFQMYVMPLFGFIEGFTCRLQLHSDIKVIGYIWVDNVIVSCEALDLETSDDEFFVSPT